MVWVQYIHWNNIRKGNWSITYIRKIWLKWTSACQSPHTINFFPMVNEVMKRHVSRGDLNSPHQQKAPVSAYWQSIMGNRLHGTQVCARSYFFTRHIRRGMTNTSATLYYIIYCSEHVEEVEVRHCSLCIRTIRSYFPLRVLYVRFVKIT